MIRSVIAVVLAALLMFVWGFVFWMFTPLGNTIMKPLPSATGIVEALKSQNLEAGNYHAPYPSDMTEEAMAEFTKQHREGPLVSIFYQPKGTEPMGGETLGMGYVQMLVSCSLMAFLLWLVGGALPSFVARWTFVVLVGVLASESIHLANPIWFNWTWMHAGVMCLFDIVGWIFAAIPLAALVKARTL